AGGERDRRAAGACVAAMREILCNDRGIGSAVEEHLDDLETVVPQDRVMQLRPAPIPHEIRIGAVIEAEADAVEIVPIRLAEQHGIETLLIEPSALHQRAK